MSDVGPSLPQLVTGYWISQAIYAAAWFDLPRHLAAGPRTAEEVAVAAGTHPESTFRLLRALASVGIFVQDGQERFALAAMGEELRDPAGRAFSLMTGNTMYRAWGELAHSVRTGEPAFDHAFQQPVFEFLRDHPEEAEIFDAAMTGVHGPETEPMIDAYDFSVFETVVDVGGGNGSVLSAILSRAPRLKGVLYDLPDVADRAAPLLDQTGVADRCTVTGGSFFESVPRVSGGPTAYMLRHIVHDWRDDDAAVILRHCREAIGQERGSRVLLVETVIEPGDATDFGKWLDLMMLVVGGKERTETQYRDLLKAAGLELTRITPTASVVSVVEAAVAER